MFRMQYRVDNQPWEFTNCPAGERKWDFGHDARLALVEAINEWENLSHRIVRVDENDEPVEVVMVYDLSRYRYGAY